MRLFGLIGYPLSHSFSKKHFDEKFLLQGITDAAFENFSISEISLVQDILNNKDLNGLSITIPYKKTVIDFLDEASDEVKKIGACNCIKIINGMRYGYNTDIIGFEKSFTKHLQPHHQQALILGSGGAAAAVEFIIKKLQIPYRFVSRKKEPINGALRYEELNEKLLNKYQIIINCSPLGTFPNVNEAPEIPYQFINQQHYFFDLVYNPAETKFLQLGKQQGAITQNGFEMLLHQADAAWDIWNK